MATHSTRPDEVNVDVYGGLEAAITAIGATKTTIIVNSTQTLAGNATTPGTLTLKIVSPGIISDAGGAANLVINGPFKDPGPVKCFDFTGSGAVSGLKESNPIWFGAVADGATSDKVAIKAAFASVIAGGKVIIPKRLLSYSYNNDSGLTDAVAVTQAVVVQLDGTIKSTSSTNGVNPPYVFNVTGAGFVLKGTGTLQGPGTFVVNETTSNNVPGLLKINADNAVVDGITFLDPPECAIYIPNKTNVNIRNCKFTGGPVVADAVDPQHYYILAYGGDQHIISGNKFYASAGLGACRNAVLYGSAVAAKNLTITNNQFIDIHEHATYLVAITDSTISNNTVSYSQAVADQLGNAMKAGGNRNVISGNTIYNAAKGGITAYDSNDTVISNNTMYDVGQQGIAITDNVANAVGFSRNIIDSNIITMRTDVAVLEGINYTGAADTTADCVGGKITNNTISYAGSTTTARAAIAVYHSNASYVMKDFDISGNKIIIPKKISFYLIRLTKSKLNHNTIYNPVTTAGRVFNVDTCTYLTIEGNIARDDQTPAVIDYFLNASGVGNNYIDLINNACFTTGDVTILGTSATYNITGWGNRLSETDTLILGTPTSGDLQNCTAPTTTTKGVIELATVIEAVAGVDTERGVTAEGIHGAVAVDKNPLAFAQGIEMTAAAAGSNGIAVADNDNIDFGTGNFILVWRGSLPDWTPASANQTFQAKYSGEVGNYYGYNFLVLTGGGIRLILYRNDAGSTFTSTATNTFIDGSAHEIAAVVIRETAAVAGSVIFYVDGIQFGSSVAITAVNPPVTIDNSGTLYILGLSTLRYAGICHSIATYNRAPTAAEVLDLYRNGINFADKWGSQTEQTSGTLTIGKRYRINNWIDDDDFTNIGGTNEDGNEFVATGTTPTHWEHSSTVVPAGATLALEPEGIQTDKWYDSSSNSLDATYPGSGSSLTRKGVFLIPEGNVSGATYGSDGSVTDAEFLYINTLSSNVQDQLDARCLESVFGTAIGTGLTLDGTTLKGSPFGSVDSITATSEGVAASVATHTTLVTTNGDSDLDNVTLADGATGQIKVIVCEVEGNAADTWKITPAHMVGGTQITFAGVGEGCTLVWSASGWIVSGNNGGTIS